LRREYDLIQEYNKLNEDYDFLDITQNLKKQIYSATIQAVDKYSGNKIGQEYPMFLRNDVFKFEKAKCGMFDYWFRCPIKAKRGGIWLPIKTYNIDLKDCKIKDSKIVRKISKKNREYFELQLTVEKEFQPINTSNVLAIDLGERYLAVTVSTVSDVPKFYGKDVRGIRRHYAYLRKQLGSKKLLKKIKLIGNKEQRVVKQRLEEISKEIVSITLGSNCSTVFIGDLKGIRNSAKGKGRRFNRIVSNMPYYQLTQILTNKLNWVGISVVKQNERRSSKTCHRCGSTNTRRKTQANFHCLDCGLKDYNADVNGVKNQLNSSLCYMRKEGVSVNIPKTNQMLEAHLI
jgi:putative transposase